MRVWDEMGRKPQFFVWYTVLFWVFNAAIVYDVINVYNDKEVYIKIYMMLAFFLVFMWFWGMCVLCGRESSGKVYNKKHRKILIFSIPLLLLLLNILLEYVMCLYCDNTIMWISVVTMIIIILYIGKIYHIKIWYPCSFYCTIYALPGGHISENMFGILLISIPVFSVIEYVIMLVLNLKRRDVSKSSEKLIGENNNDYNRSLFLSWYILLFFLFTAAAAYLTMCSGFYNKEIYIKIYVVAAIFLVLIWFLGLCILCQKEPEVQINYRGNRKVLVIVLPLFLLLLGVVLKYVMYYIESFTVWTFIVVLIAALLYIGAVHYIKFWYPVSFYCSVYTISIYYCTSEDISKISLFVMLVFSVIEYIIMLVLNRKLWYVPRDKGKFKL